MTVGDVLEVVACLEAAGVALRLDGGWGVDALVGEQTRPHEDLDLVVDLDDAARIRAALGGLGFRLTVGELPTRFEMSDGSGRSVDFHTVRFDDHANAVQTLQDGSRFVYPASALDSAGRVGGVPVRCVGAEAQMQAHMGYTPADKDRHNVRLLHERLGVAVPVEWAG